VDGTRWIQILPEDKPITAFWKAQIMLRKFKGKRPRVHRDAYVDRAALIIGDVTLEEGVNVWPGAVLRGDIEPIRVGKATSIQDGAVVHTDPGFPVDIGNGCTIAHGCIIHGCRIGNGSLIAMGAILLTGAVVGERCIIGAGALLPEGKSIPSGSVAMGMPAKVIRSVIEEDLSRMRATNEAYQRLMLAHKG
jgi:carbonic anhydrase/acetyltransferase-like protein (isoleucine patch superfamily)